MVSLTILQLTAVACMSSLALGFAPLSNSLRAPKQVLPSTRFQWTYSCPPTLPSHPRWLELYMAEQDDDSGTPSESKDPDEEASETSSTADDATTQPQTWRQRLFAKPPDDGLTFRQRLAKAGLSVVLSYGWVSNVSYSVTVSLAWYIFSKQSQLSPLSPKQWKPFLAVYAGFWVFNNIIRPVRFGLSIGVSIYFDRIIQRIQDRFKCSKGVAIGLTVFFANVVGTIALMCAGIALASAASGVPIFPPKA